MLPDHPLRGMEELRLPARRRVLLMEELSADLEALTSALASRGIPLARARLLAASRLVPGSAARAELASTHRTALRRWLPATLTDERASAFLVAATVVAGSAAFFALLGLLGPIRQAGPFAWLLAALAVPALANWAHGLARVLLDDDLPAEGRGRLGRRHAGFAVAGLAVAALGVAREAAGSLGALAGDAPAAGALWSAAGRIAMLGAIGLGTVAGGLLGWLVLVPRLLLYERADARIARLVEERHDEEEG